MSFTSLSFLFVLFPLCLVLYYVIPEKIYWLRNGLLVLASLLFYAWGDVRHLLFLILSMFLHYAAGREIGNNLAGNRRQGAKIVLLTTVAADVIILGIFKYAGIAMPLGISFYTFCAISYLADVYLEKAADCNFLDVCLYLSFFPKMISGPIEEFRSFQEQLLVRPRKMEDLYEGGHQFLIGIYKKVLIADFLGASFSQIRSADDMSVALAWIGLVMYSLQLYFDFSGYSDMAIGAARMFGFSFRENFRYPYLSGSVSEFWRRWHISLGSWFRDYVYIPLGGNRCSPLRQAGNLMVVWLLTGIWHGSTWNFVIWGLWHGCFVMLEKFVTGRFLEEIPGPLRVLMTDLVACLGWVWFFSPGFGDATSYFGKMVGIGASGFWNPLTTYYLSATWVILVIAILAAGGLLQRFHDDEIEEENTFLRILHMTGMILLFALSVAQMVGSTYQTFLYAKF